MASRSPSPGSFDGVEVLESQALLLRNLNTTPRGLTGREADRRLVQYGPNALRRRGGVQWPRELARQLTHPLALLLWLAAGLSFLVGSQTVGIAVVLVIVLNAAFAFVQELQAERAVEALAGYMPQHATVLRDGATRVIEAVELVPGDVVLLEEGERIAADMRLLSGAVEVDLSTLTGESVPVLRSAELQDADVPRLVARDLVFSGTTCTGGEAQAVVFATGMHTELGRIAALTERVKEEPSPLERQVRRVAWLIAGIAVGMAIAFVPIAIFGAGLSVKNSVVFAVGLLAGNVPEGLLPVITLALAVAVSLLARRGALVKRLSAVETLGSTDVICTDKTGTLTENRMRPIEAWTTDGAAGIEANGAQPTAGAGTRALAALAESAAACNNARLEPDGHVTGDPTEVALLQAARALGADVDADRRDGRRLHRYNFDPQLKLMTTLELRSGSEWLDTKGAPEEVLSRCVTVLAGDARELPLDAAERERIMHRVETYAQDGLRVLGARSADPAGRRRGPLARGGRARAVLPRSGHDARPAPPRGP